MGITTRLVQSVLYSEMVLFTLLIIPLPKKCKKAVINTLFTSRVFRPLIHLLYVVYAMILIMFIDAVLKLNMNIPYDVVYHTERNVYLTGFTLYLSLILKIFVNMLNTLYKEEEAVNVLKKQIKNSQTYVDTIINTTNDKNAEINELKDNIRDLNKLIVSKDIVIKQYKNNQKEYFVLLDKYNNLLEKSKKETKKTK
ncbi:hypothetical protein NCER_100604 [Vairimorpha ceranae BRL01]|uniref:Endoplasmic reticulum transmembrane protein n=2 Tax=Vairimorpha ceranae TaxID=40302 RepID=C4V808_VAIC1|nr:b-cell receptor-associated protein 31-like protein [Vairimorpha ceranae]EEQ82648.1 hypothetical protein NCER_100604 [Vairimorpha ceranae BRL01]KKO75585.1 b-cell receptor-associated protein 31-like protein [Vairimorpha ceranae]